jgi:hypothetical protein
VCDAVSPDSGALALASRRPPVAHSLHVLPTSPDATTIGVRGLPSLYFIQDGKLKHKMEGAETADNLAKLVDHFFFDGPAPEAPQVPTV